MSETAEKILLSISERSLYDNVQMNYSNDSAQKSSELRAIQELVEGGLVVKSASAIGFVICRLTDRGRSYVEGL